MIRVLIFRRATRELIEGDESLLRGWQRDSGDLLWADLADNEPLAEARLLTEVFGLHKLAIEDAQRRAQAGHPGRAAQPASSQDRVFQGLRLSATQGHGP